MIYNRLFRSQIQKYDNTYLYFFLEFEPSCVFKVEHGGLTASFVLETKLIIAKAFKTTNFAQCTWSQREPVLPLFYRIFYRTSFWSTTGTEPYNSYQIIKMVLYDTSNNECFGQWARLEQKFWFFTIKNIRKNGSKLTL